MYPVTTFVHMNPNRHQDVGAVVIVRHAGFGGVGGGVRRNATPSLRVPGMEAYVPTHLVVHHGIVGSKPDVGTS